MHSFIICEAVGLYVLVLFMRSTILLYRLTVHIDYVCDDPVINYLKYLQSIKKLMPNVSINRKNICTTFMNIISHRYWSNKAM